jgi:hypothetical protein
VVTPLVFPIVVEANVYEYFNFVENIPPGSIICYDFSVMSTSRVEIEQGLLMSHNHFFELKNVKFVAFALTPIGPICWDIMMDLMPASLKASKIYGVDYVFLGYVPGEETGLSAFCSNIRSVFATDYYGNKLDDLPLMKGINDASVFYCVSWHHWNTASVAYFARIFGDVYKKPIIVSNLNSLGYGQVYPYYPKYVVAVTLSEKAEQYEFLLNQKYGLVGINMMFYVTRTYVSIIFIILIAVTNMAWFMEKRVKRLEVVK